MFNKKLLCGFFCMSSVTKFTSFENCNSLQQFNEALELVKIKVCPETNDYFFVYSIGNENLYSYNFQQKFDILRKKLAQSTPKKELTETTNRVNNIFKMEKKFIQDKRYEHIQLRIKWIEQRVKSSLEKIFSQDVSLDQKAMIGVFEYAFLKGPIELLNGDNGWAFLKKLEKQEKEFIELQETACEAICKKDPKKFVKAIFDMFITRDELFPSKDDFYNKDAYLYKIFTEYVDYAYFSKDCSIVEKVQKDHTELFIKSLLPEQLRSQDFSQSIKTLKEKPIHRHLFDTFTEQLKIDKDLSILDFLAERPADQYFPVIKELIEKGLPITPRALFNCLRVSNDKSLNLFLSTPNAKDLVKGSSEVLLKELVFSNDVIAAEKLHSCGLDLSSALTLLESSMGNFQCEMVEWLLKKGVTTSEQNVYERLLNQAVLYKNLKIISLIADKLGDENIKRIPYPDLLKINNSNAESLLQGFILCSPLESVFELVKSKNLESYMKDLLKLTPLLVRFPKQIFRENLHETFKDLNKYIESSWIYAKGNFELIEKLKGELELLTWQEMLGWIANDRYDRLAKKNNSYRRSFDEGRNEISRTPIFFNSFATDLRGYYEPSLKYLFKLQSDHELDIEISNNQYIYTYQIPKTNENIEMTTLAFDFIPLPPRPRESTNENSWIARWNHTPKESFAALKPHIDELHKEIVDYDLKTGNPSELIEKIARCYWLIATMCQMERGTPHNAMIWLNLVFSYHNLPYPIPSLNYFFLDNIALVLPLEEFIKRFKTFLERTPNLWKGQEPG